MKKTICELFAGVGGFRVGLESSSKEWETVWANQWEPSKKIQHAYNCYESHFKDKGGINEYSNTDIALVDATKIPNHTLLVGGFPCQDYSVASTGAKGIQGKKGVLWWEIQRIIEEKKPPFVLLENVDRLLKSPTSQRGRDFGVILACFNKLGYSVEWRVINAADYGFQQRRRRIFIFASKNDTNYFNSLDNNHENLLLRTGFFASKFPVNLEYTNTLLNTEIGTDIVNVSDNFAFNFCNTGVMKNGSISTSNIKTGDLLNSPPLTLKDILTVGEVDDKYFLTKEELEKWNYMKGAKAIERTSKTGHKYTFREGAIPFPDPIKKPARTMLTSEASKNRSTHVIEDQYTDKPIKLRKLTPEECEKINGFPAGWTDTGMTHSFRYFCMGNALVVDLIKIMGEKLFQIIEKES